MRAPSMGFGAGGAGVQVAQRWWLRKARQAFKKLLRYRARSYRTGFRLNGIFNGDRSCVFTRYTLITGDGESRMIS